MFHHLDVFFKRTKKIHLGFKVPIIHIEKYLFAFFSPGWKHTPITARTSSTMTTPAIASRYGKAMGRSGLSLNSDWPRPLFFTGKGIGASSLDVFAEMKVVVIDEKSSYYSCYNIGPALKWPFSVIALYNPYYMYY